MPIGPSPNLMASFTHAQPEARSSALERRRQEHISEFLRRRCTWDGSQNLTPDLDVVANTSEEVVAVLVAVEVDKVAATDAVEIMAGLVEVELALGGPSGMMASFTHAQPEARSSVLERRRQEHISEFLRRRCTWDGSQTVAPDLDVVASASEEVVLVLVAAEVDKVAAVDVVEITAGLVEVELGLGI